MLSIGEFSKIGHISVRMLRHYDAIGLLAPAHVDEQTGYRYYHWEQMEKLNKINMLKNYRFPLGRIKELMLLPDEELRQELYKKKIELYREKAAFDHMLHRLENETKHQKGSFMDSKQKAVLMETQPTRVFGMTYHIHIGQVSEVFQKTLEEMAKRGLQKAGAGMMVYLGDEFNYDDMDIEVCFPVDKEHPDTRIMPGGPHVSTIHIGKNDELHKSYDAIAKWFSDNPDYEVAGPSFERYIKDGSDGVPEEQYETGILFPVKKK